MITRVATRKPAPGWVLILLAAIMIGAASWLAANTAQTVIRARAEQHGTVTVTDCTSSGYRPHGTIYDCAGNFTSTNGQLSVFAVSFPSDRDLSGGDTVKGSVSGPDDHTADVDSNYEIGVKLALTLAAMAAAAGLLVAWRRVRAIAWRRAGMG